MTRTFAEWCVEQFPHARFVEQPVSHYKNLDPDNNTFEVKSHDKFRLACCDCGLVHDMVIATRTKGQVIGVAVERNNRATSARRRGMKRRGQLKAEVR